MAVAVSASADPRSDAAATATQRLLLWSRFDLLLSVLLGGALALSRGLSIFYGNQLL